MSIVAPDEVSAAEIGLANRMIGDAALVALLGVGERIVEGWPADLLTEADLPRLTYFFVGDVVKRRGFSRTRWQINPWVWVTANNGGRVLLMRLRAQVRSLFDEAHFKYGDYRLYSRVPGGTGGPGGGEGLRTRPIDVIIEASRLRSRI